MWGEPAADPRGARGRSPPLDWAKKNFIERPKNTHICKPPVACQNVLKLTYSNLEFQNFPGEDPGTPFFKGRGGKGKGAEEREGKGKGKIRPLRQISSGSAPEANFTGSTMDADARSDYGSYPCWVIVLLTDRYTRKCETIILCGCNVM